MSGERGKGRNAISLAVSAAAHLIFLGMVINQTPPDYELPTPPLTAEPEQPAMQVQIVKLPPPVKTDAPPAENTAPQPTPWPKPQQLKVLPPLPQTPATPLAKPPLPQPTPSLATPANPTPPLPRTPAPTPRPSAVLSRSKPIQAAGPAKATPLVKHNPLGALNIHMPALAPPAGVPTLPMAASPGSAKTAGAAGGRAGGAAAAGSAGQRGVGLSTLPYGFMPSGGSGLRGTLVGCANAEAVRLSAAERDKCNERFGVEIGDAPKLDAIAAKRAAFDRAAARDIREQKYRNSTTDMNHDPSDPGGIAHGAASSETFKHNAGDPK